MFCKFSQIWLYHHYYIINWFGSEYAGLLYISVNPNTHVNFIKLSFLQEKHIKSNFMHNMCLPHRQKMETIVRTRKRS
jgi:hypothetical protein